MTETKKPETKKEKLLKQRSQLDARIKAVEAREAAATRKAETRKKIVLGGAVLALEKQGQDISMASILGYIDKTARDSDKKLFGQAGM